MGKKIFFFDVDDTLIDSKTGKTPESTLYSLKKLQEKGNKICISTGRPLFNESTPSLLFDIEWDGYVCFNGQGVYNKERELIYKSVYPVNLIKELIDKVNKTNFNLILIENKRSVLINRNMKYVKSACAYFHMDIPSYEEYEGNEILGMVMCAKQGCDLSGFEEIHGIEFYPGQNDFVDCVNRGMNKKTGIQKLLEYYNMDSYVAFGDSTNDIEMLKGAETAICLGQGKEEVKKISTYVTDDVDKDGIYNACIKYGWI